MNDRRITTEQQKEDGRLKHIAGLIQKLTFREMQEFSSKLAVNFGTDASRPMTDALLKTSDEILETKVATPFSPGAFR